VSKERQEEVKESSGEAKEKKKTKEEGEAVEETKEATVTINKEEWESFQKELETKKAEAAEYLDTLKRLKAEFENYKKRILKEQTQFLEMASQNLITKLLLVLDNFELALFAAEETRDYEKLIKGVEMVYSEFKDLLQKEGLKVIEAEGKEFNPEFHEAVMQVHADECEDNTIVDVMRNGYLFKGRVIRPALVKVAKK